MPYRIDIANPPADAFDRLCHLGALDVELVDGGLAAIMPDSVAQDLVARSLGVAEVAVSAAVGRDDQSVWLLMPRPVRAGRLVIAPEGTDAPPGALTLVDSHAFGTGLHPTTGLCLEVLEQEIDAVTPDTVLDVGTGSGVLALAALRHGVPRAVGLDIDQFALTTARTNARLNRLSDRLLLVRGGPEALGGRWPLVLANVVAAPLIEMAPTLVRRVGHHGRLVLSGIPDSVAPDVERTYVRQGMRLIGQPTRAGWSALVFQASW